MVEGVESAAEVIVFKDFAHGFEGVGVVGFFLGVFHYAFGFNQCHGEGSDGGEQWKCGQVPLHGGLQQCDGDDKEGVDYGENEQQGVVAGEFGDGAPVSAGGGCASCAAYVGQCAPQVNDYGYEHGYIVGYGEECNPHEGVEHLW